MRAVRRGELRRADCHQQRLPVARGSVSMSSGARTILTEGRGRSMRKGLLTVVGSDVISRPIRPVPDITAKRNRAIAERSSSAGPNGAPSPTVAATAVATGLLRRSRAGFGARCRLRSCLWW
ncbi:hypothetical protein GCM10009678_18180 [Actinomadura kijaniata]